MNEILNAPRARTWRRLVAPLGVAALLYGIAGCSNPPGDLKASANGDMAKLTVEDHGQTAPATPIAGGDGKTHTLAEFRGKVAVVNLWATWCGPCVAEIPQLAALKARYAGKPVEVAAISLDRGDDIGQAKKRIAANAPLSFYSEPTYRLPYDLKPIVQDMPTTILYDRKGIERARISGGHDWTGPDARAVIDALVAEK